MSQEKHPPRFASSTRSAHATRSAIDHPRDRATALADDARRRLVEVAIHRPDPLERGVLRRPEDEDDVRARVLEHRRRQREARLALTLRADRGDELVRDVDRLL